MVVLTSIFAVLLALLGSLSQVSAQNATPAAFVATPVAGEDCRVEPRTIGAIAEIVTEEDIANATPMVDEVKYTRPDGTAADADTVAGVTQTVRELAACVNAGDFMRFLALFSNDALRRYGAYLGLPLDGDDPLLTPDPSINEQLLIIDVEDVIVLVDGRVSVLSRLTEQTDSDSTADVQTLQFIFVETSDRWLIDELIVIAQPENAWTPVFGEGYEGVIVDAATAEQVVSTLIGLESIVGWEPAPEDVAHVEFNLPDFLKDANGAAPDLWQRLPDYKRQYAGYLDSDGRSMILVNAFCDDTGRDWHSEFVFVFDGGDCFFHVSFDIDSGTFSGLSINGVA